MLEVNKNFFGLWYFRISDNWRERLSKIRLLWSHGTWSSSLWSSASASLIVASRISSVVLPPTFLFSAYRHAVLSWLKRLDSVFIMQEQSDVQDTAKDKRSRQESGKRWWNESWLIRQCFTDYAKMAGFMSGSSRTGFSSTINQAASLTSRSRPTEKMVATSEVFILERTL